MRQHLGRRRWALPGVTVVALAALAGPGLTSTAAAAPMAARTAAAAKPPKLPTGWSIDRGVGGDRLTWRSRVARTGDARVQFFAGDRALGIPRASADHRSFALVVPPGEVDDPGDLEVRAGGLRLDDAGKQADREVAPKVATTTTPPVSMVDPGLPGQFSSFSGEYTLPDVKLPDLPGPVEMKAVVVAPRGATGNRPLAVFLHGRHPTCFGDPAENDVFDWPCPTGSTAIPSYRGYLDAQRLLASQGYLTVSISANGINSQDAYLDDGGAQARSSLIRLHLARWADWAGAGRAGAPSIVQRSPQVDLSKVLLVGHSRGGEGVDRAATDSLTPPPAAADGYHGPVRWTIRGTVQIAPPIYGRNSAADVPSLALMGGCDGDVYYQEGQFTVEGTRALAPGTALHSAVYVVGANHNYFNSEWTPGESTGPSVDDWSAYVDPGDPLCGPDSPTSVRLSPAGQRQVESTYIATAAAVFVQRNAQALPLLDGSDVWAPSAGTSGVVVSAVGAGRHKLVLPSADLAVTGSAAVDARLCHALTTGDDACTDPDSDPVVPSFFAWSPWTEDPDDYAVDLNWSAAGGSGVRLAPRKSAVLTNDQSVELRMVVPPNSPTSRFEVRIADAAGRRATLGQVAVTGRPGTAATVSSWPQAVRAPLAPAKNAGLDLARVTELQLIPKTASGQAFLLDAGGYKTALPEVVAFPRSRVDLGEFGTVTETDADRTVVLKVANSGLVAGQVRLSTISPAGEQTSRLVSVRSGQHTIEVPITVPGDDLYSQPQKWTVLAQAGPGTAVGDFQGTLTVDDDDPAPTVTATPIADRVAEGGELSWRLSLSAPAASDVTLDLTFLAPESGAELSSTDVTADWYRTTTQTYETPSTPLSEGAGGTVTIPAGTTDFEFTIPTLEDDLDEPAEGVRIELGTVDGTPAPTPVVLTGTVG